MKHANPKSPLLAAAIAALTGLAAASQLQAAPACDLASFKAPANTTLVSATAFSEPVNYCRIDGYVTTTNPGPNQVNFMLALPERHNGRYVFTIQGGAAAFVPNPTATQLTNGYAIASTDKGVRAAHLLDFSFRDDPAQSLDWAHRGVHVVAQATQEITRAHYGTDTLHRFAMGCSGGGDGTLSAAENHPGDFDGYIAAAMTTSPLEISMIWGKITQHIVNHPEAWITPEDLVKVEKVILDHYDAADGARDGLIWDPTVITLDRSRLDFLSDPQFDVLTMIQEGIDEGGEAYYPGFWMSNPSAFTNFLFGMKPPPWGPEDRPPEVPSGWVVADTGSKAIRKDPNFSLLTDFDFTSAEDLLEDRRLNVARGRESFHPTDLKGLRDSGGKLILWTGSADQAVPPENILNYTRDADQVFSPEGRQGFIQTYFVPGMFHCVGGTNHPTDVPEVLLNAAAQWVASGQAPEAVIASTGKGDDVFPAMIGGGQTNQQMARRMAMLKAQSDGPVRSYLLCPWPKKSVFKGGLDNPEGLDVNDAGNWRCEG